MIYRGQSLVQADRGFLENARRLSLYGVEFHRAKVSLAFYSYHYFYNHEGKNIIHYVCTTLSYS